MSKFTNHLDCKNNYYIKYQPKLKQFFKSHEATLAFSQLEYWSSKRPSGFWKFFEPCNHPLYKHNDSWAEEIGLSRKVFRRVFAIFGVHYKSKSAYLAQSNPFQDKMYASYYDRKTNRTYFLRNHNRVQEFLTSLWQNVKSFIGKTTTKTSSAGSYRTGPSGSSFAGASKDNISLQRSTSSHELIKSESQTDIPQQKDEKDENIKIAEEMISIWNKVTSKSQSLNSYLKIKFPAALNQSFKGSLELWTNFCKTIASSKFLMGEAPNTKFKAYLAWLIKPETIQAIEDKYYSLGDREVRYIPVATNETQSEFKRDDMKGSEVWKTICEHLVSKLHYNTFQAWFEGATLKYEITQHPEIVFTSKFKADQVQERYGHIVEAVVKKIIPNISQLIFKN